MSQRKLMAVLSLAAAVALTAGESQASKSRVESMSLTVPTLSQFTDDYVNIYYYPASVVRQNNLVLAELGNNPTGAVDTGVFSASTVTFDEQSYTVIRNFPRIGAIAFQMKQSALNNPLASVVLRLVMMGPVQPYVADCVHVTGANNADLVGAAAGETLKANHVSDCRRHVRNGHIDDGIVHRADQFRLPGLGVPLP